MVSLDTMRTVKHFSSQFIRNGGEVKSALVTVTTECNAKCSDKCGMWKLRPVEMSMNDAKAAVDFLAGEGCQIMYLTGGETSLFSYLEQMLGYAKQRGLVTSFTTNGTISPQTLERLSGKVNAMSVSVDHYDPKIWDRSRHHEGISEKATEAIRRAKSLRIPVYAMTFLSPELTKKPGEIEKMVNFANYDLGVPFAFCFPFSSVNGNGFQVGGEGLERYLKEDSAYIEKAVETILKLKLAGRDIATPASYMRDVINAYGDLPMKYPCRAGSTVISIDYNLDVSSCFKKGKSFNIRKEADRHLQDQGVCADDNWGCLTNCFKEPSLLARGNIWKAMLEEISSNPSFYLSLLRN